MFSTEEGIIISRIKQQLQRNLPFIYQLLVKPIVDYNEVDLTILHTGSQENIPDVIFLMKGSKRVIRRKQRQGVVKIINLLPRQRKVLIIEKGTWRMQSWTELIKVVEGVKVKLPYFEKCTIEDLLIEP